MIAEYVQSEKLWRSSASEISPYGLGHEILAKLKADNPDRIFEVNHDTGKCFTVKDIHDQTITVAQNLMRLGVNKGDVVVVYSNLNERITPITFACYTIGAPINFFETKFEGEEISRAIDQIDPAVIFYEEEYKCRLTRALENVKRSGLKYTLSIDTESPFIDDVLFKPVGDIEAFEAPNIGDPTKHPAIYLLTSGSTGFPKVVLHSHSMMIQSVNRQLNFDPQSRTYCFSALRWISQVVWMLLPVFHGVSRIYTSTPPILARYIEIINNRKITNTMMVPRVLFEILKIVEHSKDPFSLSSLKNVRVVGDLSSELLRDLAEKMLPNCKLFNCYGTSELAGTLAVGECLSNRGVISNNFMVRIIDDDGKPLGPGEMGRICAKATVPFLRYLKNEAANKKAYLDDGWFNTGDCGFVDSENLVNIVTRYCDLLCSAGTIIIPTEVEDIVSSHPSVLLSALVGHSNPESRLDDVGIVFVVPNDMNSIEGIEEDLKNFVKDKLTKAQFRIVRQFKVIPKLPLTSCGKIDRLALRQMAKAVLRTVKEG